MTFQKINRREVPALLDQIDSYNKNERYNRAQFEKYLNSPKKIDATANSLFYGVFDDSCYCMALAYLNKIPRDCVLVAEVQCTTHGWGRVLLDHLFKKSKGIWLTADPTAGESLLEYYRSFGLEEWIIDKSIFNDGKAQHFFFTAKDPLYRKEILETICSYRNPTPKEETKQ